MDQRRAGDPLKAVVAFLAVATVITIDFFELWGLDLATTLFAVGALSVGLVVLLDHVRA